MDTYYLVSSSDVVEQIQTDWSEGQKCRIPCPFHDGTHSNLELGPGFGWKCFKCGEAGKILDSECYHNWQRAQSNDRQPLEISSKAKPQRQQAKDKGVDFSKPIPGRDYIYTDSDGSPVHRTTYYYRRDGEGKQPIQYRREGGQWKPGLTYAAGSKLQRLPYNLSNIVDAQDIIYCEGEKDVETLRGLGVQSATTLGSANSKLEEHQHIYFRGKDVVIIPDEDAAGYAFVRSFGRDLSEVANSVYVCFLFLGLHQYDGTGNDFSDFAELVESGTLEDTDCILTQLSLSPDPVEWLRTEFKYTFPFESPEAQKELSKYDAPSLDIFDALDDVIDEAEDATEDEDETDEAAEEATADLDSVLKQYSKPPLSVLPRDLQQMVRQIADDYDCPTDWPFASLLAAAAGTIGRRVVMRSGLRNWTAISNLAMVIVAPPSTGKSHIVRNMLEPLAEHDASSAHMYKQQLRNYEAQLRLRTRVGNRTGDNAPVEPRPVLRQRLLDDSTMEQVAKVLQYNPEGVIWYRDEFAALFKSLNQYKGGNGTDVLTLLNLINGDPWRVNRKDSTIVIPHPAVTIVGTTQPQTLRRLLTAEHLEMGLAQRFLFVNAPAPLSMYKRGTNNTFAQWRSLYARLSRVNPYSQEQETPYEPMTIHLTTEALELWTQYANQFFRDLQQDNQDNPVFVEMVGKILTYFMRLCLVLHCVNNPDAIRDGEEVQPDTVNKAFRVAQYVLWHNYITLNYSTSPRSGDDVAKVLKWAKKKKLTSFTARDLCRNPLQKVNSETAKEIMQHMQAEGLGVFDGQTFTLK